MTTNPGYKKKLIEVALPLDEINRQSTRENYIYKGNPSAIHKWWAQRPLAACRAVIFAQLVDDPGSRPEEFPTVEDQKRERQRLFGIIQRLVNWDNINDEALYKEAHAEIVKSCDGNPPPILDPFAGGGSIPVEALRLGLEVRASDLNPVAVLINKALVEMPQKWVGRSPVFPGISESRLGGWPAATGLAEDVRRYGGWIRDEAKKRIGHLYPTAKLDDGTDADVIAWIWSRTVRCLNPACGGTMPLMKSFWLSKKKGNERWAEPIVDGKSVRFEIRGPKGQPREGTVGRTGAECLICGAPAPLSYVRDEGKADRIGAQLVAVVVEHNGRRTYVTPTAEHAQVDNTAKPPNPPEGFLPDQAPGFRVQGYGMVKWSDLFTNRQLAVLTTLSDLVVEVRERIVLDSGLVGHFDGKAATARSDAVASYADLVATYLAFAVSKTADYNCSLSVWYQKEDRPKNLFARQAIPMVWDYPELNVLGKIGGTWMGSVNVVAEAMGGIPAFYQNKAVVEQENAADRDYDTGVIVTDPPYYDNIAYADLSDFFYVWLRRTAGGIYPNLLETLLTPKVEELVANPHRQGGRKSANSFFEDGFRKVFSNARKGADDAYPISVFYAFKQSESDESGEASTGWETLLEGMISSGWMVSATWPIRTERGGRMRDVGSNALASSVVLICRPQDDRARSIDRRAFIGELKAELPAALRELQEGGVAPVDLAQAAIGPGMSVYSRYSRVVEADGSPMRVRAALVLINQIRDEALSEQEGDFDSDSRFCVKWFEQHAFNQGPYGEAESFSKSVNTSVDGVARGGVLWARAGKVQLIEPGELPASYDPAHDDRISVWEVVMHLAKRLNEQGLDAAAALMASAKARIDMDTAKELTYLLYSICERKKWARTALLFNELGMSWPDIERASRTAAPISDELTLNFEDED